MTRPILVLSPRFTSDSIALGGAAEAAGWEVRRLHGWQVPEELVERDVAVYGEPLFAAYVAETVSLGLVEPPFSWLTTLPSHYCRRQVDYLTLAEAWAAGGPAFFKPADDKCFPAAVYPSGSALPAPELLPEATPVLRSEPVAWEVEYRCFVLNRGLAALSVYLRDGEPAEAADGSWPAPVAEMAEAAAFATRLLADPAVELPPAVVVDVGRIAGDGWAVVEANPAWAAGIYGCDPYAVLPVIRRAVVRQSALTPEDTRWLISRRETGAETEHGQG